MVASGISRRGVCDSSATGAMLSTPAMDRNAKMMPSEIPEKPAVAAVGSNGLLLKCPSAPPRATMITASTATNAVSRIISVPMMAEDSLMLEWFMTPMTMTAGTAPTPRSTS